MSYYGELGCWDLDDWEEDLATISKVTIDGKWVVFDICGECIDDYDDSRSQKFANKVYRGEGTEVEHDGVKNNRNTLHHF